MDVKAFAIKIKYSCVHSANYQGGSGKVVIVDEVLSVNSSDKLGDVCDRIENYVSNLTTNENFPIENPRLISKEFLTIKEKW